MSIEAFIPSPTLSETELRLHYEKLNTIFNSLREIIFTIDIEKGIIENVNDSVEVLGYKKKEWEGQNFRHWPLAKRRLFFLLLKHASKSTAEATSQPVLLPTKGDVLFVPFEFSTVLYTFKNKKYLLCVLRDTSERERLMHDLEKALQKERELNELRSSFIATASHQFRTPLTVIQSGVEIMNMYLEDFSEEKRKPFDKHFKRIETEVSRLQDLMNDVLLLGRTDAKRTPFHPQSMDLVDFCTNLIENRYNNRYPNDRKIILSIEGKKQLVEFDPKLLHHSLENILSNSYKYSTAGNIQFKIKFEFETVNIHITDHGIGIPEKDLSNLFQPFYRASNSSDIQGTGLGLSIVKDFIDEHHGQIFVMSEVDKGTTVTISLPLKNKIENNATQD